jgi:hypothetical protein
LNIVDQIESPEDTGNDAIKFQVGEDFYLFKWVRAQQRSRCGVPSGDVCEQLLSGSVKLFGSWLVSASDGGSVDTSILTQMEIQG